MTPNTIICGDCRIALADMPAIFSCCISSPPYWSLRDYGLEPLEWGDWKGCLGLEPTPELYIKHLCDIYDLVWKVMRKDGTVWVNLGDTYNAGRSGGWAGGKHGISKPENAPNQSGVNVKNIPAKSLVGIPEMFVLEMQKRGWIRRATIIWVKGLSFCENYDGSCMPDSAKDRPNKNGFEYIYLFTKSNDTSYWVHPRKCRIAGRKPKPDYIYIHKNTQQEYDYRPPIKSRKLFKKLWSRRNLWEGRDYWFEMQYEESCYDGRHDTTLKPTEAYSGRNFTPQKMEREPMERWPNPLGRQFRNVWLINPQPCKEAHFATFPERLVEICLKAGCPEFVCTKCGLPCSKIYEIKGETARQKLNERGSCNYSQAQPQNPQGLDYAGWHDDNIREKNFKGYTDCGCNAEWRPGLVLDMFRWFWNCGSSSCKNAA